MCHSCGSSHPGCFVPATLFLLGKGELWIPAFTGLTIQGFSPGMAFGQAGLWTARPEAAMRDSRLCGNDPLGLALQGEASCFIRLKC